MPYRSGTFDDLLAIRQRQRRQRRRIAEANTPSGSQPFQTTRKVEEIDLDLTSIANTATQANATAVEAKTLAQSAASVADNASEKADEAREMADALSDRADAIETGQSTITTELTKVTSRVSLLEAEVGSSAVITTRIDGDAMPAVGSGWTRIASVAIPTVDGMTGAMVTLSAVGRVNGGTSELSARVTVDGVMMVEAPCPYAGAMGTYPGGLSGDHLIALSAIFECSPGATAGVELMAGNAGDYPVDPANHIRVSARIDYVKEDA